MAHLTITFLTDALRRPTTITAILPTDKINKKTGIYKASKSRSFAITCLLDRFSRDAFSW